MTCEIIKDLIPMYTDKTASFETGLLVKEHLEGCPECRAFYDGCKRIENKVLNTKNVYREGNGCSEISNLDREFASFSGKLKKRRTRQVIIGVLVLLTMALYVTFDIIKAVNKAKER